MSRSRRPLINGLRDPLGNQYPDGAVKITEPTVDPTVLAARDSGLPLKSRPLPKHRGPASPLLYSYTYRTVEEQYENGSIAYEAYLQQVQADRRPWTRLKRWLKNLV